MKEFKKATATKEQKEKKLLLKKQIEKKISDSGISKDWIKEHLIIIWFINKPTALRGLENANDNNK